MSYLNLINKKAGRLNIYDNIIIDDGYDEQDNLQNQQAIENDDKATYFTLKDRKIFRRPLKHQFAFKWTSNAKNDKIKDNIQRLLKTIKVMDVLCGILSMLCLLVLLTDNELIFRNNIGLSSSNNVKMLPVNNYLRAFNLVLTLPLVIMLIVRNYKSFQWAKENHYLGPSDKFRRTRYFKQMLMEVIIHACISPPGFENKICYWVMFRKVCNPLSDLFMLFTMLRVYTVIRALSHFTKWTNAHSSEIGDFYGVLTGMQFVLKCIFKSRPFLFLIAFIMTIAIVSSFTIRIFERSYYSSDPIIDSTQDNFQDYENFWNVLWLTTVTMTTVGYGDFYCKSHFGRFTTTITSMLGIFAISLMLVSLENTTKLNQFQALSYEFLFKLQSREKIRHQSAIIITELFKLNMFRKKLKTVTRKSGDSDAVRDHMLLKRVISKIEDCITINRLQMVKLKKSLATDIDWPVEELLRQLKSKLDMDVEEI